MSVSNFIASLFSPNLCCECVFHGPSPPLKIGQTPPGLLAALLKAAKAKQKHGSWAFESLLAHHGPVAYERVSVTDSARMVQQFYNS